MSNKITLTVALLGLINGLTMAQTAPVMDAIGNQSVADGSILYFKATATDPNEDDLTWTLVDGLPGMNLFQEQGIFSWIPESTQVGTHEITLEVSDGSETDSETISITVSDALTGGHVIYVDAKASGANNGSSWANAYNTLTSALDNDEDGDQIWMAAGTYAPPTGEERTESFVINRSTVIYGGFEGGEGSRDERDVVLNPTILSGDRNGDDATTGRDENSYRVMWLQTTDRGMGVDGLLIRDGYANGDGSFNAGAAIISFGGNAAFYLRNSIIEDNEANFHGVSSILDFGNSSNPSQVFISNTIVRNNTTSGTVISLSSDTESTIFTRLDIYHSNFVDNGANVIDAQRESIISRFYNSLFMGNDEHYLRNLFGATSEFYNCAFDNDPEEMANTGISQFEDNLVEQTIVLAEDHQFDTNSPLKDAGNDTYAGLLGAHGRDIAGNSRINEGSSDIGAVEYTNYAPVLNNEFEPALTAMDEDAVASEAFAISDLIDSNDGIISDRNVEPRMGIAIIEVDNSNGRWQYSVDGGEDWDNINPVEEDNALLLSHSDNNLLRFKPDNNFNGTVEQGITFRAWDRYTGSTNDKVDASVVGGLTVFSEAMETIAITIAPVNDAPTLTIEDQETEEGELFELEIIADDIDGDDLTYSIDAASADKGMEITSTGSLSWQPGTIDEGNHEVTILVSDGTTEVASTFNISVTARLQTVTGIEEEPAPRITIYPNPTTHYLALTPASNEAIYRVSLYNLQGRLIHQDEWATRQGEYVMDISAEHAGAYIINLQSNTTTINERILKQ